LELFGKVELVIRVEIIPDVIPQIAMHHNATIGIKPCFKRMGELRGEARSTPRPQRRVILQIPSLHTPGSPSAFTDTEPGLGRGLLPHEAHLVIADDPLPCRSDTLTQERQTLQRSGPVSRHISKKPERLISALGGMTQNLHESQPIGMHITEE
jgi:hypothetical protein